MLKRRPLIGYPATVGCLRQSLRMILGNAGRYDPTKTPPKQQRCLVDSTWDMNGYVYCMFWGTNNCWPSRVNPKHIRHSQIQRCLEHHFPMLFYPRCTPLSWIKAYQSHTPNSSLFEEDVFCSKTWVTWVTWVISIQCRKTPACSNIPGTGGHHLPMAMAWSNPCRKAGTIISVQIESDKKESKK